MAENLIKNVKVTRVMNAVAAGTSDQTSSAVDMAGFESCTFIALLGTLTATQVTSLKAQQCDTSGGTYADLEGSDSGNMADDDSNQCIVLEVVKPRERYLKAVLLRGTANAVIDGIIAIQSGPAKKPTVHDATTVFGSEVVVSPAEGTA